MFNRPRTTRKPKESNDTSWDTPPVPHKPEVYHIHEAPSQTFDPPTNSYEVPGDNRWDGGHSSSPVTSPKPKDRSNGEQQYIPLSYSAGYSVNFTPPDTTTSPVPTIPPKPAPMVTTLAPGYPTSTISTRPPITTSPVKPYTSAASLYLSPEPLPNPPEEVSPPPSYLTPASPPRTAPPVPTLSTPAPSDHAPPTSVSLEAEPPVSLPSVPLPSVSLPSVSSPSVSSPSVPPPAKPPPAKPAPELSYAAYSFATPPTASISISKPRSATGTEGRDWEDRLGATALQDNQESRFLDAIDDIRKHALDCELDIPELVVCGSQSSGKSSVLEAITRVPFPRGDTTCTRFVTQIRMLRGPETSVSISIIPDSHRPAAEQAVLRQFSTNGGPSDISSMIEDAGRAMGLKTGLDGWSNDVLSIEVHGPTLQRLTLVDLPGLIDVDKKGRGGDSSMVEEITDNYIKKPQSIILAVINADTNVQGHRILEKAKRVDPSGKRTFGIITKPDRVEAGLDNENDWFKLMDGKSQYMVFQRGWHVLVNRNGQETRDETPSDDRDKKEEAFFKEPVWGIKYGDNANKTNRWHTLYPTENWGVKQLRPRLRTLLFRHTQEQIPHLKKNIKQKLGAYEDEIRTLDRTLLDSKQIRNLMEDISSEMQIVTDHGAKGTYREHEFFPITEHDQGRYLRAKVRKEGELFGQELKTQGHRTDYAWGPDDSPPEGDEWVVKVVEILERIRGTELPGYHDPHGFDLLFIHYSSPWKQIAEEYVEKVYDHCRIFLREVIKEHFSRDLPTLSDAVWEHVFEERLEEYRTRAFEELNQLEADRKGLVATENELFISKSSEKNAQRLAMMASIAESKGKYPPENARDIATSLGLDNPGSRNRQVAIQFIDHMLAYYALARDRFIDNVIIQVTERHLLSRLRKVFRQDWIRDEALFERITHDPNQEDRRKRRDVVSTQRKSLRACLTTLDDLERAV